MDNSILLVSPSTLLTISSFSGNCSLWLSQDCKSLMIEMKVMNPFNRRIRPTSTVEEPQISTVSMNLSRDSDGKVISSLYFPIRSPSRLVSIRIEPWISLIFGKGEMLRSANAKAVSFLLPEGGFAKKPLTTFSLNVYPMCPRKKPAIVTVPAEIYSDQLKIGSSSVAVSRELLSLHSDFFSNLFYGEFMERNQELKEIKDISESEFVGFLHSFHRRRLEFTPVKSALDSLVFADRFLMPRISTKVLPYLKKEKLSDDLLTYALILSDRVHNNGEILAWILTQFPSKTVLLRVLHATLPTISSQTAQMCTQLLMNLELVEESDEKIKKLIAHNEMDTRVGFYLKCYDSTRRVVEFEDCFSLVCARNGAVIHPPIWDVIPPQYSTITIEGRNVFKRDDNNITFNAGLVYLIEAYKY